MKSFDTDKIKSPNLFKIVKTCLKDTSFKIVLKQVDSDLIKISIDIIKTIISAYIYNYFVIDTEDLKDEVERVNIVLNKYNFLYNLTHEQVKIVFVKVDKMI